MTTPTNPDTSLSDADRVVSALMQLCPDAMREMFSPMVQMAVAQIPADSLSSMATDLESARDENGNVNVERLIEIGKQFGLTDEMVAGYQASFAAADEQL